MEGHSQKLSDFMVNEKMPQRARDALAAAVLQVKRSSGCLVTDLPMPYRLTSGSRKILYFSLGHRKLQLRLED